jgi:hypothetical protein
MVQIIGLMIGAYIFTRMAEVLNSPTGPGMGGVAIKFFAFVTMAVSALASLDPVTHGWRGGATAG